MGNVRFLDDPLRLVAKAFSILYPDRKVVVVMQPTPGRLGCALERDALHAENAELKVRLTKTERAMRLQKSRADDAEQELSDDKGNMSWEDATS